MPLTTHTAHKPCGEASEGGSTVCISVSSLISLPEQDGCYVEGLPGNKKGHTQYIGRPVAGGRLGLYKGVSCVSKFVFFTLTRKSRLSHSIQVELDAWALLRSLQNVNE